MLPQPEQSTRPDLQPDTVSVEGNDALLLAALLATIIASLPSLVLCLIDNWPTQQVVSYVSLAVVFGGATQMPRFGTRLSCWFMEHLPAYLVLLVALGFALQALSGDDALQPIVFTIPMVYTGLRYSLHRTIALVALYLGVMLLGLWLGGNTNLFRLLLPFGGYGTAAMLIIAFTRLAREQAAARQDIDQLATQLAHQRDDLARLVQATATFTRNLDLPAVVEQIAQATQILLQSAWARVWLLDQGHLNLVASVPASTPPVASPTGSTIALMWNEQAIGMLEFDAASQALDEQALLQPLANAAAGAIENARLYDQARQSAALAERNRLARELHDTIAQGLTAISMQLAAAQRSFERDSVRTQQRLTRATELTHATLEDVRRSVWTLAEPLIDSADLPRVLAQLAQRVSTQLHIPVNFIHHGTGRLSHTTATQVYRIVQEAMQNVAKHAHANHASISLEHQSHGAMLQICDDGIGFDPATVQAAHGDGFGLRSLYERARLIGGTLAIESTAGDGTCLTLTLPYSKEEHL